MRMVRIEAEIGTVYVNPLYVEGVFTFSNISKGTCCVCVASTGGSWVLKQQFHSESSAEARARELAAAFEAANMNTKEEF